MKKKYRNRVRYAVNLDDELIRIDPQKRFVNGENLTGKDSKTLKVTSLVYSLPYDVDFDSGNVWIQVFGRLKKDELPHISPVKQLWRVLNENNGDFFLCYDRLAGARRYCVPFVIGDGIFITQIPSSRLFYAYKNRKHLKRAINILKKSKGYDPSDLRKLADCIRIGRIDNGWPVEHSSWVDGNRTKSIEKSFRPGFYGSRNYVVLKQEENNLYISMTNECGFTLLNCPVTNDYLYDIHHVFKNLNLCANEASFDFFVSDSEMFKSFLNETNCTLCDFVRVIDVPKELDKKVPGHSLSDVANMIGYVPAVGSDFVGSYFIDGSDTDGSDYNDTLKTCRELHLVSECLLRDFSRDKSFRLDVPNYAESERTLDNFCFILDNSKDLNLQPNEFSTHEFIDKAISDTYTYTKIKDFLEYKKLFSDIDIVFDKDYKIRIGARAPLYKYEDYTGPDIIKETNEYFVIAHKNENRSN